jgi:membrane fusion protein (multidrug efflux system)
MAKSKLQSSQPPAPAGETQSTAANVRVLERPAAEAESVTAEARNEASKAVQVREDIPPAPRRSSWRRTLLFALLPVALVAGGYIYVTGGAIMSTDNAYIRADIVGLSNDISGIVSEVLVRDNQQVAKGDPLFKLDDQPFALALARADAELQSVRNELLALRASYRGMQAQIAQAQADVELDTTNLGRQEKLAESNFTPQATLDASRNTLTAAQQKLASLKQQLAGIAANLNGDPDAPVEHHPRYKQALAARDEAARQLSHTTVRAPFAGVVTNVPSLQPGQYLAAATIAFNIVSSDHVWVEANPKETELTSVRPGQKATIEVDMYPGETWTGTVDSISPASSSSFSLLPAENSSGNWVKVVQRIPLRIRVDTAPGKPPLRVGMSAQVSVDTGHPRGLPTFLTGIFGSWDKGHG